MKTASLRKLGLLLVAVTIAYFFDDIEASLDGAPTDGSQHAESANWVDGTQAKGSGVVSRILADDNDGSRHQRFILRLASGRTVLVAHNIDLARRIDEIQVGDKVAFNGEFESNERGGVIHWTHHDPAGYHEDGWLKHNGQTYE